MTEANLPEHTREFLYREGDWDLPGTPDMKCEGAAFHSPRPLFVHEKRLVLPQWWGESPDKSYWQWAPKVLLCGTCADNVNILLQMLHATDGDLDWAIRREFGNALRALAQRGWDWFAEHRPKEETA